MNQKSLALQPGSTQRDALQADRYAALMRYCLFKVLERAIDGCLVIKEQGAKVAVFGRRQAAVQAEVEVLDPRLYARMLLGGSSGAGEAYVEGWWTTPDITAVVRFFALNLPVLDELKQRFGWLTLPVQWLRQVSRINTRSRAKRNILSHYDLGNDLYRAFLDAQMQYSSAIYCSPHETLEQAQHNKLQRICEQLKLREGDHLLEIGSGWGGLAIFAAEHYGCQVTTTTISDAQYRYASEAIIEAGLTEKIRLLNRDYRELEGQYDKLVSVEMVEAVGHRYLPGFFKKLNALLKPGGLLMMQAITIADQRYDSYRRGEDFIQKHIFPGGFLPSISAITGLMADKTDLVMRDLMDIGVDYARTISAWRENLFNHRQELYELGYDDRFMKLWSYYFGYCEGGFLERRISAVQLLAEKPLHA